MIAWVGRDALWSFNNNPAVRPAGSAVLTLPDVDRHDTFHDASRDVDDPKHGDGRCRCKIPTGQQTATLASSAAPNTPPVANNDTYGTNEDVALPSRLKASWAMTRTPRAIR